MAQTAASATSGRTGFPTSGALLCAVLLVASVLGPWHGYEGRVEGGPWQKVRLNEPDPGENLDRVLAPLLGVVALLGAATARRAGGRREIDYWIAIGGFELAILVLRTTDAAEAVLGVGDWSSTIFVASRPKVFLAAPDWTRGQAAEFREVFGWGTGLAFWSSLVGLVACGVGIWALGRWRARQTRWGEALLGVRVVAGLALVPATFVALRVPLHWGLVAVAVAGLVVLIRG